jgi:hypothetical protein
MKGMQKWGHYVYEVCKILENHKTHLIHITTSEESLRVLFFTRSLTVDLVTEITQPCIHTCDGLFICQLYLLPDLLEEMDCKEDTPLTLPFASFISLSQLIIVIWIKTSVGITTVFHTGISRAVSCSSSIEDSKGIGTGSTIVNKVLARKQ